MDWRFGELPLHPLLVHIAVILIPVAALLLVLSALWPTARRRLGILTPLLALAALLAVPLTTNAGDWLADRVGRTPLVDRHETLGEAMLPWSIAVFLIAAAVWAWHRFGQASPHRWRMPVAIVLASAAVVVAAGSVVVVVQVGESGTSAVWTGNFSEGPLPAP